MVIKTQAYAPKISVAGADPGGVHAPPKIGKNMFFWCSATKIT